MSQPSILCAVDFTDACHEALRVAIEEAGRRDAVLDIVHVWFPTEMVPVEMTGIGGTYTDPELPAHLQAQLDELPVPMPADRVRRHLVQGNAADEIVAKAKELDSELLVVGTHTRGAIARWFLGSVVTELLRINPCPVLVCRTPPPASDNEESQSQTQTASS